MENPEAVRAFTQLRERMGDKAFYDFLHVLYQPYKEYPGKSLYCEIVDERTGAFVNIWLDGMLKIHTEWSA